MDEEKAKVPNTFFVSIFVRSVVLQVPVPELADWNREQSEAPIIQGKWSHLDTHRSMQLTGITQGY